MASATGVDFVHFNGMSGEYYYCEQLSGGGALFDYDLDGDLDLFVTQGHMLGPGKSLSEATLPPATGQRLADRLFRNDLVTEADGRRRPRFTDVTEESRLDGTRYSMGAAVGDYDNDGWPDLYVTTWNSANQLFRNLGDGTFAEVTAEAGVGERRWSVSAVFFDFDRDGWLDLFAANNLNYTYSTHKECADDLGNRDYCGPIAFSPIPDTLYRNLGPGADGSIRFEDVTASAGLASEAGPGLGVTASDFDHDGWLDLYVANDGYPNHLWLNQGDGTFRNDGLLAGAAMNDAGLAEAGMGVSAADFDDDGDEDLFVAHLTDESNTLYTNDQGGIFSDRTVETGLATPSVAYTGFGTGFLDYDNDGRLDLLVVNGAVTAVREQMLAGDTYPLHQRNQLYHNLGGGRFQEISKEAGEAFTLSEVSRGLAFGDLDNDGDTDAVVFNNAGPLRLLINQVGQSRSWAGFKAIGTNGQDLLGSWLELDPSGLAQPSRRVRTDGSYASAHDPRVLFGLGEEASPVGIRITWPDRRRQRWTGLPAGRFTILRQETSTEVGA
jgi:hypothetical protein